MTKFIRNAVAFAIILTIISSFFCITAFATESGVISVTGASGKPGDVIKIGVKMEKNPGIFGMSVDLTYDSQALTCKNYKINEKVFTESELLVNIENKGVVTFGIESSSITKDNTSVGEFVTLEFEVNKDAANGETDLSLDYMRFTSSNGIVSSGEAFNVNEEQVPFTFKGAKLKITGGKDNPASKTDANSDGTNNVETNANGETVVNNDSTNANNDSTDSVKTNANGEVETAKELMGSVANEEKGEQNSSQVVAVNPLIICIAAAVVVLAGAVIFVFVRKSSSNSTEKNDEPKTEDAENSESPKNE